MQPPGVTAPGRGYVEFTFQRRLIISCRRDNAANPSREEMWSRPERSAQTSRKRSNFQLLNCESVAPPIDSNLHRKRRLTLPLKNGHARQKRDHYTRGDAKENDFLFFLFRLRSSESSTLLCRSHKRGFPPFMIVTAKKFAFENRWEEKSRAKERKRSRLLYLI